MTKRALSPLASAAAASKKTATEATLSTLTTTATDSQPLLRIASWNITSFKSCVKNGGLMDFIGKESPDILALQETKLNNADDAKDIVPHSIYPYQYFHCCSAKKGYAGSAVFSKIKPLCVTNGFLGGGGGGGGDDDDELTDNEGRLITLEFDRAAVVASYVPNASQGLKRLDWKTDIWNRGLTEHFKCLADKPVIWMGDMNVCREDIDLTRPNENRNKTAGFTDKERQSFEQQLQSGLLYDCWRELHPEKQQFTYFSRRFNCRSKGIGWRLDYAVASKQLSHLVRSCEIMDDYYGPSDHIPVMLSIDRHALIE